MQVFEGLVYIDPPKTASTYISKFLKHCCIHEELYYNKHLGFCGDMRKFSNSLIFISVRHPLSQYRSLYRFGREGKGAVYEQIREAGYSYLYDPSRGSFSNFMDFMLDKTKRSVFYRDDYSKIDRICDMGLISYRHLVRSINCPFDIIARCDGIGQLYDIYIRRKIWHLAVRQERLLRDLLFLCDMSRSLSKERAKRFIEESPMANTTRKTEEYDYEICSDLERMLIRKEALLIDHIYDGELYI